MSKHMERDLERLQKLVLKMAGLVEEAVFHAAQSLQDRDSDMAERVIEGDNLIDQLSGKVLKLQGSMVETKLPPQTAPILKPKLTTPDGYSNYKRVQ